MKISKKKFEALQLEKNLTQIEISKKCNISPSFLSEIIRGKNIRPTTVVKIMEALDVSAEDILEEETQ